MGWPFFIGAYHIWLRWGTFAESLIRMEAPIVNRVGESGLITLDLGIFLPEETPVSFDLADYLYMGLILREKDFREAMARLDTARYDGSLVAVYCSADAIIPYWAYMLVVARLSGTAREVYQGTAMEMEKHLVVRAIEGYDVSSLRGQRVVVKGCGDREIGAFAFVTVTARLVPIVRSLMYGEPCSTVPVFKRTVRE
ncbi:MAG: DUF2480 family protein [Acidobacteria bacterium]|nr:DUF2480 family protein [Acidobacteriota bacterium]